MTKINEDREKAPAPKEATQALEGVPSQDTPKVAGKPATGRLPALAPPKPSLPQPLLLSKPGSSPSGAYQSTNLSKPISSSGGFAKVPSASPSGAFAKVPGADSAQKLAAVTRPPAPSLPDPAKPAMASAGYPKVTSDAAKMSSGGFAKVPSSSPGLSSVTRPTSATSGTETPKPPAPKPAFSSGGFAKVPSDLTAPAASNLTESKPPTPQPMKVEAKPLSSGSVKAVSKPVSPVSLAAAKPTSASNIAVVAPASLPNLSVVKPTEEPAEPEKSPEPIAESSSQEAPATKEPAPPASQATSAARAPAMSPSPPDAPREPRDDDFVQLDVASLMGDSNEPPNIPIKKANTPAPSPSAILSEAPQVIPEGLILDSRYRLLKMLGEGGMGAVYKAEHLLMRKPVAIKILKKEAAVDRDLVMRFIREAQLASKLSNPHCVTIHDFGQTPDRDLYLVMELIEGEVLRDIMIEEGRLSVERAYWVMVQLLEALGAAHDIGVIHRDVKPENVMMVKDANRESGTIAKLLDFGIARPSSPVATGVTRSGFTVGTPGYIAPEQALGRTLDGRTDLYAAAVIFYEMICGRRPYLGNSPMEIITNQVSQPPPRPSQVAPEAKIPIAIEDVLLKALAKEPDKRYANAKELRLALEKALEKSGKTPPPIPEVAPAHHEEKVSDDELLRVAGHRRATALFAGLLGGLAIGVSGAVGYFIFTKTAPHSSSPLSIPIAVDTTHHFNPQQAKALYDSGDFIGAASILSSLSKRDRSTPEAQVLLAVVQSQLNNWSDVRAAIRLARHFGPFPAGQAAILLRNATLAQSTKDAAAARTAVSELGADALREVLSMLRSPDEATKKAAYAFLLSIDEQEASLVENARAALEQSNTCPERQALLQGLKNVNSPTASDELSILERELRLFCIKASTQPSKP